MAANDPDYDPIEEDVRVGSLEERLKRAQTSERARSGRRNRAPDNNYRLGARVLADLIGGVAGGFIIGFALDSWFETSPWFLLAFLFIGTGVAFWNIYRISSPSPDAASADEDKEDVQG